MRILLTGGAGFIGSHIADRLIAQGHSVLVVDDLSTGRKTNVPQAALFRQGDIRDAAFLAEAFDTFRPDVVGHQAAQTSVSVSTREPVRDALVNVVGSIELLQQCVRQRVQRVVYASTGGAVYGEVPEGERAGTDRLPRPLSPYACSKYAVECYLGTYAKEHGLASTILRYANVYGPRQDPHGEAGVVAIFGQRLVDGEPLQIFARKSVGDEGCVRDYVFVGDVVEWNVRAIEGKVPQPVVNVCTGAATSTRELAEVLAAAMERSPELRYGPRRPGDVERSVLDSGGAHAVVPPTSLRDGLAKTAEWLKATAQSA